MDNKLTPNEQRLFDCLKERQGEIIGHRRLIAILLDLWMPPLVVRKRDKGLLRQYISRLRQKIEKDPALPDIIITHRGRGYSYEGPKPCKS